MSLSSAADQLVIKRLNLDSSWFLSWGGASLVLDPWLVGSEVDIARWFNEQWHARDPIAPADLPPFDAVVVTQSYSDHCHEHTLRAMPVDRPILVVPKVRTRLAGKVSQPLEDIPDAETGAQHPMQGLRVSFFHPGRKLDPVYHALLMEHGKDYVLYAPHGFSLNPQQLKRLAGKTCRLLMTTCMTYRLPALLGGTVNPGLDAAVRLARQVDAKCIVDTHDEDKRAKGLVQRLARVVRPDRQQIQAAFSPATDFLQTDGYEPLLVP